MPSRTNLQNLDAWKKAIGAYQDGALEVQADGLKINWSKLREPERLYEADYAWVKVRNGAVSLFFGKADLDDPSQLTTRLEIRYPIEKFIDHFWKNSREFHEALRKLPQWPPLVGRDALNPENMKAQQSHSERANFEYMARYGSEAILDFYYLAPSGIARLAQGMGGGALRCDPVVRVQTTLPELLYLLESAAAVVEDQTALIPASFRPPEGKDDDE